MFVKDFSYKRKLTEKVNVGGDTFEYTRTLACLPLDIEQQYFNKVKLRLEEIKKIHHVNFIQTFEVVPVSQDYHMLIIQEHCKSKALREINVELKWLQLFVRQMLDGMQYLNLNYPKMKYIGNLDLDTITVCELDEQDRNKFLIKLPYYYLNYITYDGTLLNFDHIDIYYASPEWLFTILNYEPGINIVLDFRSDLWSLGLIILEKMLDKHPIKYFFEIQYNCKVEDIDTYFDYFIKLFDQIEFNKFIEFIKLKVKQKFNQEDQHKMELLIQFLESCLKWNIKDRLDLNQLLYHPFLTQSTIDSNPIINNQDLEDTQISLDGMYYLFRINYTNLDLNLPNFNLFETKVNNFIHLNQKQLNLHHKYNNKLKFWDLNLDLLKPKLKSIGHLITEFNLNDEYSILFNFDYNKQYNNTHSNVAYQFSRMQLFNKLIAQYPQSKYEIKYHAQYNIPPYYRNIVWACLLGVDGNYQWEYNLLIKNQQLESDKQILVDLPRCHSYHTLLNSKSGQKSLNRVIKAFLNGNNKIYWQGLDSIAATFLTINEMDEALSYKSLNLFLDKHMQGYFNNDTHQSLHCTVHKYKVLLAYLDPILFNHLIHLDLNPTTYAVSWFLTSFTHVLSLDKIYLLFDKFLVFKLDYPIYFACSILIFKRHFLLKSGFNECVAIFNHLNDLPFNKLLELCHQLYSTTPIKLLKLDNQVDAFSDSIDNNELNLPTFMFELTDQYPILILDLRSQDEFHSKHITKSYNVNHLLNEYNNLIHLLKIINKDQQYIVGLVSNDVDQLSIIGNLLIQNNVSKVVRIQNPIFECNCESKTLDHLNKNTRNSSLLSEVVMCSK